MKENSLKIIWIISCFVLLFLSIWKMYFRYNIWTVDIFAIYMITMLKYIAFC